MAFRDRNQGFGFVYVDIKKLLEQTDEISQNPESHPQEDTAFSIHLPKKPTPVPNPAAGGPTTLAPGGTVTFTASYTVTQTDIDQLQ